MSIKSEKFNKLMELEGYEDDITFLDECMDSIVPGICMNKDCDQTYNYEPDQNQGYCEECGTNTVSSALILCDIM